MNVSSWHRTSGRTQHRCPRFGSCSLVSSARVCSTDARSGCSGHFLPSWRASFPVPRWCCPPCQGPLPPGSQPSGRPPPHRRPLVHDQGPPPEGARLAPLFPTLVSGLMPRARLILPHGGGSVLDFPPGTVGPSQGARGLHPVAQALGLPRRPGSPPACPLLPGGGWAPLGADGLGSGLASGLRMWGPQDLMMCDLLASPWRGPGGTVFPACPPGQMPVSFARLRLGCGWCAWGLAACDLLTAPGHSVLGGRPGLPAGGVARLPPMPWLPHLCCP